MYIISNVHFEWVIYFFAHMRTFSRFPIKYIKLVWRQSHDCSLISRLYGFPMSTVTFT